MALFVIAQWLIAPAINAGVATHAPAEWPVPAARTLAAPGARDVTFPARDGTRLSAGTSRATMAPPSSCSTAPTAPASTPCRSCGCSTSSAGYGILAYDARGHGQSAGQTNALGWAGANDLAGAVAFLDHQPGINPSLSRARATPKCTK